MTEQKLWNATIDIWTTENIYDNEEEFNKKVVEFFTKLLGITENDIHTNIHQDSGQMIRWVLEMEESKEDQ
jgi:hypothetical protein